MLFDFNELAVLFVVVVCIVAVLTVLLIRRLVAGSKTRSLVAKIQTGVLHSANIPSLEGKALRGAAKGVAPTAIPDATAGLSYTAIAVSAAEAAARAAKPVSPTPSVQAVVIDYSGEASDVSPGASYAAIAVAAARAKAVK